MSDVNNPYQSPQADIRPENSSMGGLSENMISYLRGASPWLRFMGILGFIGSGSLIVGGIGFAFAGGLSRVSPFASIGLGGVPALMGGVVYGAMGVFGLIPARFTYNFGANIRNYMRTNADQDLELAFMNNRSLWKFNGILAIIGLATIPVFIAIAIIALVTSSMFR